MFSVEMLAIAALVFGVCFFVALGWALSGASERADHLSEEAERERLAARTHWLGNGDARELSDLTVPLDWERERA